MKKILAGLALATIAITGVASAQDSPFALQIGARKGVMDYRQLQLITLGQMAKGEVEYNAEAAQKAADNVVASAMLDQSMLWPQGSDSDSNIESRAMASIWAEGSDIGAKGKAFAEAAMAMQAAAGVDLASLQAAMGPLGETCVACHKDYRAPAN
ncbi:cytochrome c [Defluviimonas sp. WL0050]|uniref:Cytochrome c n=1 Tax=Albidovulum litorale TaxID=2984134 RepID=A0ABT2ZP28_9RHOB|nr:cytochrome c [Defluviimonas sp. WL0050]MCV2872893.1 cytochrome c [Defluviimonas sp. WL0050]